MKKIAILGATGSVGRQALEVIKANSDRFRAAVLTAGSNATDLVALARLFSPDSVVIADASRYEHRSEEHTSELQSLMRISYAVFCLKKKKKIRMTQRQTIKNNNSKVYTYRTTLDS